MKSSVKHYDLMILGGGPAGYSGAIHAAKLNKKVAIIEKDELGGATLWKKDIFIRIISNMAQSYFQIHSLKDWGFHFENHPKPDLRGIWRKSHQILAQLASRWKQNLKNYSIDIYEGIGIIKNPKTIELKSKQNMELLITGDNLLISTGSIPMDIPGHSFDKNIILSPMEISELTELPDSILILGGGPTGCELAFLFAAFGSQTILIESKPTLLPEEDKDISNYLERLFRKYKIRLLSDRKIVSLSASENQGITAHLNKGEPIHAGKLLPAIGQYGNTGNIGLEQIGIRLGAHREIMVNDKMETNIPSVYAAGSVTGTSKSMAHSMEQAIIAVDNLTGKNRLMDDRFIPMIIFTHPPFSRLGLTEKQAIKSKLKIKIGNYYIRDTDIAFMENKPDGMIKIILEQTTNKILGIHIIGDFSGILIDEIRFAMKSNLPADKLIEQIQGYPSWNEIIRKVIESCLSHGN